MCTSWLNGDHNVVHLVWRKQKLPPLVFGMMIFFLLDLHTILQTEEQLGHIKEQT